MASPTRRAGLWLVLGCLAATLLAGLALKGPCASGDWGDGRQYRRLCYTDIVPLYGTEHLSGGRLPFLQDCPADGGECDEYPVLTMYAMRVAAWAGTSALSFYYANVVLLALAATVTAVCLYVVTGRRALYFALAPTLAVYAFTNWDLLAVMLATAATLAYLRRRDARSGLLLGLGAAAKLYPALLLVPFVLGRFKEKKGDAGIHLAWAAVATWILVNLPFSLASPSSWAEFFRFNSARGPDWDSLWFIGCHLKTGELFCDPGLTRTINVLSFVVFVAATALVWQLRRRRFPDFPRWTLGLPILVLFLLSNKVYSPQYGLWLLPWFALALPDLRLFAAFEAADVAVFVTRFSFFGRYTGIGGLPFDVFEVAILFRAVVLVAILAAWTYRRPESVAESGTEPAAEPADA